MSTLKSKGCLFLASSLCDGLEDNDIKQVTTLLLNKEANPNTLIPTYGVTPFHLVIGNDSEAFAEEVTKLFLRHGGNPNVRSVDGLTPVHVAAAWGRVAVLELLLANGGDPLCLDDEGRSPFHYAFDGKYYKAIVILGKYCESVTKEEKITKHKITFDKLIINNGDIVAEYVASQISDIYKENISERKELKRNEDRPCTNRNKCSFVFNDNSFNSDDLSDISTVELRIREEIDKEKCLVTEIINQLSHSLKSNSKNKEFGDSDEQCKESQYDTSPSSVLCTDDSVAYDTMYKFLLKPRMKKRAVTPRYKRKMLGQNNNTKIPLLPAYNPCDSIISKSPNFLTGKLVEKEERYASPKTVNRESKFKDFTPCRTRNETFRSKEFNVGKEMARSTPRRRKQFYRQYSSLRKLKKNTGPTSSENTSPDSTNSLSPDQNRVGNFNHKINKNIAVRLYQNKYDDDTLNTSFSENKDYIKQCVLLDDSIEALNTNLKNLETKGADSLEESTDSFKLDKMVQEKTNEDMKTNDVSSTFKEKFNTLLSSFKSQSYISVQEEYKYEDPDEGIAFLERRIYTLPPCKLEETRIPTGSTWPQQLNLSTDIYLADETLRRRLVELGDNPGPITNTTRQLYLKRLVNLESREKYNNQNCRYDLQSLKVIDRETSFEDNHCIPVLRTSLVYGDWINQLGRHKIIEKNIFREFSAVDPSRKWREGMNKTCFNYLLLDPRITKDLPSRAENMTKSAVWSTFLSAIFYVGKGSRNRPYSHLKDAFKAWISNQSSENAKIQQILSIWNDGCGVICLHIFQNIIPVEAYTREAAILDTLGLQILKNCKTGDYYGIAATWNIEEKRNFGRYLLYQAMQIFLYEGERQIFPQNL